MRLTKTQAYLEITHSLKEFRFKLTNYRPFSGEHGKRNMIISCTDEHAYAGGLCDRFKGMICAYAWAKANGYDFRIFHQVPYDLSTYLKPAAYDWTLKDGDMERRCGKVRLFLYRGEKGNRFLKYAPDGKQVHYYGNMDYLDRINEKYGTSYDWGELYRELFRPCDELQQLIHEFTPDTPYVSASFRFMKLLGDFDEKNHRSISSEEERQKYISECLGAIEEIKRNNPGKKVLVTSDSGTFIELASKIDGVFTVPGKRVHIQYDTNAASDEYMTCFLDFYLLTGATKVYRVCYGKMYKTKFPLCAAKVHGHELIDIEKA